MIVSQILYFQPIAHRSVPHRLWNFLVSSTNRQCIIMCIQRYNILSVTLVYDINLIKENKLLGITFVDGPLWKEHRQFAVKQLRNVGFGKTKMEKEIQDEMLNVLQYLEENCGKPVDPINVLAMSVMNILWSYIAGTFCFC